jgi:hypothetical protein
MNLDAIIFLQRNGMLSASKNRVLDIGPQTIYYAGAEQIAEIVALQGCAAADPTAIERLVHASTPRPQQQTPSWMRSSSPDPGATPHRSARPHRCFDASAITPR